MSATMAELAREQTYFDAASEHRERMRASLAQAPAAAANKGAAAHLRRDAAKRLERIGGPDEAVAFGRMDDESGETLYLGHHLIMDDESEVVVVNWQAPAAAKFYKASHDDACGLVRKRSFDCAGNTIQSFDDIVFKQLADAVAELESGAEILDDALLADLDRDRTGEMQEIVRTIQAAQYDLIRAPLDQLLIVQGGPGTGKTAVALHRVSWLLFNHHGTLLPSDFLVVGPSPTFTRYTRTVLPSLGDIDVEQRDIHRLHPPAKRGGADDAPVARIKGEARMAGLLRRGLYARVGLPDGVQRLDGQVGDRRLTLWASEIGPLVERCFATSGTYTERRQLFRDLLLRLAADRLRAGTATIRTALDPIVDRLWPSLTAVAFLRDLLGSRDRLLAAAGDEFTARDVALLRRRPAERVTDELWTDADLPLLDEAEHLLHGTVESFQHIVVDEAQDLSPMQLRAIARRSTNGSMTLVGDIAQSTGHWARDGWSDVVGHLPTAQPSRLETLRYGYRVPRQVFEYAARLLPVAAPEVAPPEVVRNGPADPTVRRVDAILRGPEAVTVAMNHAAHGRSVAIICPAAYREDVEEELQSRDIAWRAASKGDLGSGINLVSPQESKGLEFDAVVVVEPVDIIAEDPRGHRLLYVALTRTTKYLDIVGVTDPLSVDDPAPRTTGNAATGISEDGPDAVEPARQSDTAALSERPAGTRGRLAERMIEMAAQEVVAMLRDDVPSHRWIAVLDRAREIVDDSADGEQAGA